MTIYPFVHGKSLVWDKTSVNIYAATNIREAAADGGAATRMAEDR